MPVTSSAKKALRTATRRHQENLVQRESYKKALKDARKAIVSGDPVAELASKAQSTLDRAAKNHTIHPNKAARLKSRLAKKIATTETNPVPKAATKAAPKKRVAAKKTTAKAK